MNPRMKRMLWIAPLAIPAFALFIALGGWIVRELWNWLTPSLFGWKVITFWQALGLLALCRILFGGFGVHGGPRGNVRRRIGERLDQRFRERLAERWDGMSPEERERVGRTLGFDPPAGEGKGA